MLHTAVLGNLEPLSAAPFGTGYDRAALVVRVNIALPFRCQAAQNPPHKG